MIKEALEKWITLEDGTKTAYKVIIYNDGEIVLGNMGAGIDEFGHDLSATERIVKNPYYGMAIYRECARIVIEYLHTKKPHYIYFSIGFDETRLKLYQKFAKILKKHKYECYYQDNLQFYFIRKE